MTISEHLARRRFGTIIPAFAVAVLVATLGAGSYPAATAASDGMHHIPDIAGWQGMHSGKGTCPSQGFLHGPGIEGQKMMLNVNWVGKNDEDSGLYGYWALDHFTENLKVWLLPNGTYYAEKTYDGVFIAPQGASSPGSTSGPPTGLVQNVTSFGSIAGGYAGTFSGTFAPGTQKTSGYIGTFDYGGTLADVLLQSYGNHQVGDRHAYDWESAYFAGGSQVNEYHWGWSYELDPIFTSAGSANQWCNYNAADGGNSGDIFAP